MNSERKTAISRIILLFVLIVSSISVLLYEKLKTNEKTVKKTDETQEMQPLNQAAKTLNQENKSIKINGEGFSAALQEPYEVEGWDWVLEPSIKALSIKSIPYSTAYLADVSEKNVEIRRHFPAPVFLIDYSEAEDGEAIKEEDRRLGLIDLDGKALTPPGAFNRISVGLDRRIIMELGPMRLYCEYLIREAGWRLLDASLAQRIVSCFPPPDIEALKTALKKEQKRQNYDYLFKKQKHEELILPTFIEEQRGSPYIVRENDAGLKAFLTAAGEKMSDYEFEDVSPIVQNRAFVKKDGLWGIIKFKREYTPAELSERVKAEALLRGNYMLPAYVLPDLEGISYQIEKQSASKYPIAVLPAELAERANMLFYTLPEGPIKTKAAVYAGDAVLNNLYGNFSYLLHKTPLIYNTGGKRIAVSQLLLFSDAAVGEKTLYHENTVYRFEGELREVPESKRNAYPMPFYFALKKGGIPAEDE